MKNIKNIYVLVMALVMISIISCSDDVSDSKLNTNFTVSSTELQFSKTGGETYLYVRAADEPTLTASDSWISIVPQTSESKTVHKYLVSTTANTDYNDRSATISVVAGSEKSSVTINETSTEGLIITSPKTVSVGADGGTFNIKLQSNNE